MNPTLRPPPQPTFADPLSLRCRVELWLAIGLFGILASAMPSRPALADGEAATNRPPAVATAPDPAESGSTVPASDAAEHARRPRGTRTSRLMSSDGMWPGMVGIALVLAVVGGIAAVARRFVPNPTAGTVQVVGRVSLSPKHSVYTLRVGRRVLLLGTGPQGPPSLITELDEVPEAAPAPRQEEES